MRLSLLGAAGALVSVAAFVGPAGAAPAPARLIRDMEAARLRVAPGNTFQADTTVEPSIAVNPANPRNAVLGYQAGRGDGAASVGFATTMDGGKHWASGLMPKLTGLTDGPFSSASDPVIAFGPHNVVYFSSLAFNATESAIVNHTSRDGGRHWDDPTFVLRNNGTVFDDKNWIIVDNGTGTGHHTGRVYAVWDTGEPVLVSYSDDQGKTWLAAPSVIYPGQGIGTIPLVMPNGDLAVVYTTDIYVPPVPTPDREAEANTNSRIVISLSKGAGTVPTGAPLTFAPPITIASDASLAVRGLRAPNLPTADVDRKSGRIYVGWADHRYRTDEVNDVVVASSTDGVQWSLPVRVNRGTDDDWKDHFTPALAVADDGSVRVAYRQRQEDSDEDASSPYVDTYFQQSTDGGKTWGKPLRVNSVRTDLRFAAFSRNAAFLGDYMQVAPTGAYTYIVRCEALRTNPHEQGALPPDEQHHQRTWVAVVGPKSGALS